MILSEPKYRLCHPENYLFLLHVQKYFPDQSILKNVLFNFEHRSTDSNACRPSSHRAVYWTFGSGDVQEVSNHCTSASVVKIKWSICCILSSRKDFFVGNENKWFWGWPNRCFGCKRTTSLYLLTVWSSVHCLKQWSFFSRSIAWVTPKMIHYYYL